MLSYTRQVHSAIEEFFKDRLRDLGSWRLRELQNAKRYYPGEVGANYLLAFIESLTTTEQEEFLGLIRNPNAAYEKMEEVIEAGRNYSWRISPAGIVLQPNDPEGAALLALLQLHSQGRLGQLKRCRRCRAWFYARFKSQRFCSNPETNCQWKDYHTPTWRKQHRERNRKHQRDYRNRLFPKKGKH